MTDPPKKRILIVEDDPINLKILGDYLVFKGFSTILARDGYEGLEKFHKETPHIVLLDALLPKMDGFEVLRRIRETSEGKDVPILMMSAVYKAPGVQLQAQKIWGANGYLVKPFELSELEDKIRALIQWGETASAADARQAGTGTQGAGDRQRSASRGIEFSGHLMNMSFPQVLAVLWQFRETGVLILKWGKQTKEISFVEGQPVEASSSLPSEGFDAFLVKKEKVAESAMKEALRFAEESGRPLQSILLSLNVVSQEELELYITYSLKEIVLSCFAWPEGTYRFQHDDSIKHASRKSILRTVNIILEGIKRHYSRDKIEALFYTLKDKTLSIGKEFSSTVIELDLTPSERRILSLINGERTVGDIMYISGLDVPNAFAVLYTLLVLDIIKPYHV